MCTFNISTAAIFALTCLFILTPTLSQKNPAAPPPPKPAPNRSISPYHFVDHFCLTRRLEVRITFCLHVLRASPGILNVKDNIGLLYAAAQSAIQFGNKTIVLLNKLSKDKTNKNRGVIEECESAYQGYVKEFKILVEEAKTEADMAAFDTDLARIEINRCVKAVRKTKSLADIGEQNKIALDYARLAQSIAQSIQ